MCPSTPNGCAGRCPRSWSVRKGTRFTVLYRSRPAFQIVPMGADERPASALDDDPLYRAAAVGRSVDGLAAADHDTILYRS
jgi:hypothetical protein